MHVLHFRPKGATSIELKRRPIEFGTRAHASALIQRLPLGHELCPVCMPIRGGKFMNNKRADFSDCNFKEDNREHSTEKSETYATKQHTIKRDINKEEKLRQGTTGAEYQKAVMNI